MAFQSFQDKVPQISFFLFQNIYLAAPGLSCSPQDLLSLVAAHGIFSCGMQTLIVACEIQFLDRGLNWRLSHWTIMKDAKISFFTMACKALLSLVFLFYSVLTTLVFLQSFFAMLSPFWTFDDSFLLASASSSQFNYCFLMEVTVDSPIHVGVLTALCSSA